MVRNDHDLEPVAEREVRHVRAGSEGVTDAERRREHRDQGHRHSERAAWGGLPRASFQVQVRLGHRGLWVSCSGCHALGVMGALGGAWWDIVALRYELPKKPGPKMDPGFSRQACPRGKQGHTPPAKQCHAPPLEPNVAFAPRRCARTM